MGSGRNFHLIGRNPPEQNPINKKIKEFLDAASGYDDDLELIIEGLPIVQRFINENPNNINERDNFQNTALILASQAGNLQIVDALLAVPGIDINARNLNNRTALLTAICNKHFAVVESLLGHPGVSVNEILSFMHRKWPGFSTLMLLVEFGEVGLARTLLAKLHWEDICYTAVNHHKPNAPKLTAEIIAREKGHHEILDLIYQRKMQLMSFLRPGVATFSERIDKLAEENHEVDIKEKFICSVSLGIMNDPVTVSSGITYDRSSLQAIFKSKNYPLTVNCPQTHYAIHLYELWNRTNMIFKNDIEDFVAAQEKLKAQNQLLQNNAKDEVALPANSRKRKGASLKLFDRNNKPEAEENKRAMRIPHRYRLSRAEENIRAMRIPHRYRL